MSTLRSPAQLAELQGALSVHTNNLANVVVGRKKKNNEKKHPKTRRRLSGHCEQPKDKDANLMTSKNRGLSRSGGGMKVNWRLEIHLRYVGFADETHLRCELAGTKSPVRLPSEVV